LFSYAVSSDRSTSALIVKWFENRHGLAQPSIKKASLVFVLLHSDQQTAASADKKRSAQLPVGADGPGVATRHGRQQKPRFLLPETEPQSEKIVETIFSNKPRTR
jgi:hypothetical protein